MGTKASTFRVSTRSIVFAAFLGMLLVLGYSFGGLTGLAVAHDDDSGPVAFTPEDLKRARVLFRHYCMDCHGPKMTGDEHDENLFCPDVQGKDVDDYQEAVLEGPDDMPAFLRSFVKASDGYLILSNEDFALLTLHETTFRPNQP